MEEWWIAGSIPRSRRNLGTCDRSFAVNPQAGFRFSLSFCVPLSYRLVACIYTTHIDSRL